MRALQLVDDCVGDAFLDQQARARTADLALVEPDRVDHALDRAIEIGIFKNDERRFAAKLKRKFLAGAGRRLADRAADFRRAGERDLVDVGMIDQRFAGGAIAGDDVDDAFWEVRLRQISAKAARRAA